MRQLQQNAAEVLRRVRRGQRLQITDRGRAVALLVPIRADGDVLDDLEAAGRLSRSEGDLLAIEPVALPRGAESPSKRLARLRRDER